MRHMLRRIGSALAAGAGLLLVVVLLTSNPPQWRIGFRLDETRYVAAVWITDDPPRAMPAR